MVLEAGGSRPLVHPIILKGFPNNRFSVLFIVAKCTLGNQNYRAMENDDTSVSSFFSFRASHSPHTSFRCRGGVTEACAFRQLRGTGSIPVHGSNKTNDEVVAKLLTWKWRARKTSSSQDRQGNLSVLLHFTVFMSIFARRGGAI